MEIKLETKERRGPDSEPKIWGILKYLSAENLFEKSEINHDKWRVSMLSWVKKWGITIS